jgi:hypothetical protein
MKHISQCGIMAYAGCKNPNNLLLMQLYWAIWPDTSKVMDLITDPFIIKKKE